MTSDDSLLLFFLLFFPVFGGSASSRCHMSALSAIAQSFSLAAHRCTRALRSVPLPGKGSESLPRP